jgi:hypothetical protein
MNKPKLTDSEAERILDSRMEKAMRTDFRYLNAESAEKQAYAEHLIGMENAREMFLIYEMPEGWIHPDFDNCPDEDWGG